MSNVADPPLSPEAAEVRDGHLRALQARMEGAGYRDSRIDGGALVVYAKDFVDGIRCAETIACRPRVDDFDRWWFWTVDGEAITEADRVVDAAAQLRAWLDREET